MREIITAIDIGTTKVCAITAEVTHDSLGNLALRILGEGQAPSKGIRRGVVVNVPEVTAAVGEAVERCERDSGEQVLTAYVGIAGSHIQTLNNHGFATIDQRNGVTGADMQDALDRAKLMALPESREIIHTIARTWSVDEHDEVENPVGMQGRRLETDAHIVTGSSTAVNNLVQCVANHGIDIDELVLEPLASNESVLRDEERRMGTAIVDMGGGTTDIAVFRDNCLCHTQILDMGGNHFTNDIAVGLHAPFETAEELKLRYGNVVPDRIAEDENVWAAVFGEKAERSFSRRFISHVLEARAEEMFEIIQDRLRESGDLERLPAGIVLTGGSSQLPGLSELGRHTLGMPVRIGKPGMTALPLSNLSRLLQSPAFATSVGLLLWGMNEDARAVHTRHPAVAAGREPEWMNQAADWLGKLLPG